MEPELKKTLLEFALLFTSISALSFLFRRLKFPIVLAPVLMGIFAQYTPFSTHMQRKAFLSSLKIMSSFGVIFLLFYIGLQLDLQRFKDLGTPILKLTGYSMCTAPHLASLSPSCWDLFSSGRSIMGFF